MHGIKEEYRRGGHAEAVIEVQRHSAGSTNPVGSDSVELHEQDYDESLTQS